MMMEETTLNQWDIQVDHWCPAQIYYYFIDSESGRWCIYLRWRHQDPWTAELVHCDEEWDFQWDHPETKDILEVGFSEAMAGLSPVAAMVGFLAAFISGCFACKWMINLVKKGKLVWFAVYCAIVGIIAIVFA